MYGSGRGAQTKLIFCVVKVWIITGKSPKYRLRLGPLMLKSDNWIFDYFTNVYKRELSNSTQLNELESESDNSP